jgi:hypothetical protein
MPVVALFAWALWLDFNQKIAKHCGVSGLKVTPKIAEAFNPRVWMQGLPRQVLQRLADLIASGPPQ